MSQITVKLPVRFVIMTNELPKLNDPSGALVGRLVVLRQTLSWYGKEDTALTPKLLTELPAILLWAIEGYRRLLDRGYFLQPESSAKMIKDLEDLSSPIGAFLTDKCCIEPGAEIFTKDLFAAWKTWCEEKGNKDSGNEQTFGRDLRAAHPGIDTRHARVCGFRVRKYVGVRVLGDQDKKDDCDNEE